FRRVGVWFPLLFLFPFLDYSKKARVHHFLILAPPSRTRPLTEEQTPIIQGSIRFHSLEPPATARSRTPAAALDSSWPDAAPFFFCYMS
ncbi:hypothetical protein M9458_045849, partial [Cirrhinus mrigala]